jgi:hypothetical protein
VLKNCSGVARFLQKRYDSFSEDQLHLKESRMTTTPTPGPVPVASPATEKAAAPKPTKILPTDRIGVPKQLDMLRAYAAVSNSGAKPAPVNEVAVVLKTAASSVSLANAFLASINLITRSDAGSYTPCPEVVSFFRAYEWDKETASHKLAPVLREAWFWKSLQPRLAYAAIEEEQAISVLAEAAAAAPEYKKELRTIIEFLVAGGVVRREGSQIKMAAKEVPTEHTPVKPETKPVAVEPVVVKPNPGDVRTGFVASPAGGVSFNVNVNVDMAEFANWRPDRIQAFFRGMAEVLAAKADVEKGGPVS